MLKIKGLIMLKTLLITSFAMLFVGCSTNVIVATPQQLPTLQKDAKVISLFRLENYTDTPRAGMRAGNILEGILKTKGFTIVSHLNETSYSFNKAAKAAESDGAKYFLFGGVSEWRYKTGIDGEPAVSVQLSLYDTKTLELVWSATGSDSDWGNGSIGTTAQNLLMEMVEK